MRRAFPNNKTIEQVATEMKVTPDAVSKWRAHQVPAERVLKYCAVTELNPEDVRPDIYPPYDNEQAQYWAVRMLKRIHDKIKSKNIV